MTIRLIGSLTLAASALFAQGLVRLNVTALDAGGAPVDDLKAADFQVTDQGKPEKIVFLRQVPATVAAGPHEFSNRTGAPPHTTVILFDLLNQNQTDRLDAWHKLGRSLQQLQAGDSLYLYLLALEGNLIPIHEIGGKAGDDKTWTQQVEKNLDKAMKAASHARPTQMSDEELVVKKTYVALETLANQMVVFPGRRDIVWITNTMPNVWNTKTPCNGDWVDCALYVPHLAVTLAADNVAVNPLSYTSSPDPAVTRDLEQLAGVTGGQTYFGDEIRSVLTQLDRDSAHTYSIFYDPSADNWDSKFHKVRVTTERKGLKVLVKQRYFALPDKRPDQARQQPVLAAAFQASSDDPGIGLRATVTPGAATVLTRSWPSAMRCSRPSGRPSPGSSTPPRTPTTRRGRCGVPSRSSWAVAARSARWTWSRGTGTCATCSRAHPRTCGTSSTCSTSTASASDGTPRRSPGRCSRSTPRTWSALAASARSLAAAGADGMIIVGPADPAAIGPIGQVLAEAFPAERPLSRLSDR